MPIDLTGPTMRESALYAMGLSDPQAGPPTGAAGALAGTMGAALIAGVCTENLDSCRSEKAEEELLKVRDKALSLRRDLIALVEHGAQAAARVAAVRHADKRLSDQERIQALLFAAEVPLRTAESCHALLNLSLRALGRTGIKALPELGTGTALAFAGVVGGIVTARSFLAGIEADICGAENTRKRAERIFREAEALRTQVIDRVRQHLP